jgi:hypothetical protein
MKSFFAVVLMAGITSVALTGLEGTATAQACRKNYYPCSLNAGGKIDPNNPGCCWQPLAGPPNTSACPKSFYACDLNKDGRLDPKHPGCCWNPGG